MPDLSFGNQAIKNLVLGSTDIKAVYLGAEKVWPSGFSGDALLKFSASLAPSITGSASIGFGGSLSVGLSGSATIGLSGKLGNGIGDFSSDFGLDFAGGTDKAEGRDFSSDFSNDFNSSNL